jgi:hypothetical protein
LKFIRNRYSNGILEGCGGLPKEGFVSVTMPQYRWEQVDKYFEDHKAELRKRGIKSTSALISFWLSEDLIEASR